MKTHADFKRVLQMEGTRLETLSLAHGFASLPASVQKGRLYVGQIRFINKADTTGVYLKETPEEAGNGSFLGYDKASDWKFENTVGEDGRANYVATHTMGMSYRIIYPWRG
jgi:hypothetical protein